MTPRTRALWRHVGWLVRPHVGLLLAGFLCMLIGRACSLYPALASREFLDVVVGAHRLDRLTPLVLKVVGAAVLQGLAGFGQVYLLFRVGQDILVDLRSRVQVHVAQLPVQYFDTTRTGAIVSRIMSDVESVRNLTSSGSIDFLAGVITSLAAVGLMLQISLFMTLICIPIITAFCVIARRGFISLVPIYKERGRIQADVVGRLTESINGIRVIKAYRAEASEEGIFAAGVRRLARINLRATAFSSFIGHTGMTILGVLGGVVMYAGGRGIAVSSLTTGDYVMFSALLAVFLAPVGSFVVQGGPFAEALAALGRIQDVLDEPPEEALSHRTHEIGDLIGDVEFDGVSFAYEPEKPVLHGLSLHALPDSVTALVGPSGAGKSTLISLLAAFAVPTTGTIRVDGVDLSTVHLNAYRRQLAVVLQDTFLFAGTIRENVAFSRPNANEAEILAACRVARVDEFALTFPDGYDTVVGERGVKLSGGQKQRVSIARAILANPRILVLDEATSSLDSVSEALIQEALGALMKGRTTFVIAHRLSTIRRAHQILVLDKGRIVERGTHDRLLAAGALYAQLYAHQYQLAGSPGSDGESEALATATVGGPALELTGWSPPHQDFFNPR